MNLYPRPPWLVQTETQQKKNIHRVATRNRLFNPELENNQTRVTLRENPDRNVTLLSSHATTLNWQQKAQTTVELCFLRCPCRGCITRVRLLLREILVEF
jgi:hypothetical protein